MDNWGLGKLGYSVRISNSVIKGIVKDYSTRFSLNSLAKEMEISAHKVVRDYLELLENLMLIKQVLDFISLKPEMTGIEVRWSNVPKKRKFHKMDNYYILSKNKILSEEEISQCVCFS